jgi:hypothetical protein
MNRRGLLKLLGLGGAAAVAAPAVAAIETDEFVAVGPEEFNVIVSPRTPIFNGSSGIYNGIIIREVDMLPPLDLNECCRAGLREWYEGERDER